MSGVDPLYTDDTTAQVTHTTVRMESSVSSALSGSYAIKFFDSMGEDWITKPIEVSATGLHAGSKDQCDLVSEALLDLPSGVIPSIDCSWSALGLGSDMGVEYTLTFTGNPGPLREIELDLYLDGSRSTVEVSSGTLYTGVHTPVIGESMDHFKERCEGITVKILADSADVGDGWETDVRPGSLGYLSGPSGDLTPAEAKLLKKCLADSDWDHENNVEVADWDYGFVDEFDGTASHKMIGAFPHAIKVVPVETTTGYNTLMPASYHLVWYDSSASAGKEFRVANLNSGANLAIEATEMYVYTTKGTVQQMAWGTESDEEIADNSLGGSSSERIVGYFDKDSNRIYTNYDTSCKNNPASPNDRNHVCAEKGDKLFVVDSCWGKGDVGVGAVTPFFGGSDLHSDCADSTSPNYNSGNIYTVNKVYTVPKESNSATGGPSQTIDITGDITLKRNVDTYIIEVDASFGWDGVMGDPENSNSAGDDTTWSDNTGTVVLFHFTPHQDSDYEYISECSGRGLCLDGEEHSGWCSCYDGYTGIDCSIQSVLAKQDKSLQSKWATYKK